MHRNPSAAARTIGARTTVTPAPVLGNCPVQWRVKDGGNGNWYTTNAPLCWWIWHSARANKVGSHLASLTDVAEPTFQIGRLLRKLCPRQRHDVTSALLERTKPMKVTTIIGARPQFVKAAVVSRAFRESGADIVETIVHTGQHYDANMSDVFFADLDLPKPKHNLGIGGGSHGHNTGRMLEAIELVLMNDRPDWVLVYGDTDSTLAGALAAAKLHIRVAHVEAGLRSFNRRMPEEVNRVLTDHAADLLFTPTSVATQNLEREGIRDKRVMQVGDVMFDAAKFYSQRSRAPVGFVQPPAFVLATVHRAENTDSSDRLREIISALDTCAAKVPVVLPLHPRTRQRLAAFGIASPNITMIDPVGYLEMIWLLTQCQCVVTDSGGVQKEAYFFAKPCITTRDETEWVELVDAGANQLVGADSIRLRGALQSVLSGDSQVRPVSGNLYGSGQSALEIVRGLAGS